MKVATTTKFKKTFIAKSKSNFNIIHLPKYYKLENITFLYINKPNEIKCVALLN